MRYFKTGEKYFCKYNHSKLEIPIEKGQKEGKVYRFLLRREENDVDFFLEIVPSIYVDDINPCLAPPLDVIDFCHATRTQIDIDMYLFNSENE